MAYLVPIGVGAASTPLKRVYIPCRFLSLIPKFYRYPINNDNNAEEIRKTSQKAPCFFCFVLFFFLFKFIYCPLNNRYAYIAQQNKRRTKQLGNASKRFSFVCFFFTLILYNS